MAATTSLRDGAHLRGKRGEILVGCLSKLGAFFLESLRLPFEIREILPDRPFRFGWMLSAAGRKEVHDVRCSLCDRSGILLDLTQLALVLDPRVDRLHPFAHGLCVSTGEKLPWSPRRLIELA